MPKASELEQAKAAYKAFTKRDVLEVLLRVTRDRDRLEALLETFAHALAQEQHDVPSCAWCRGKNLREWRDVEHEPNCVVLVARKVLGVGEAE